MSEMSVKPHVSVAKPQSAPKPPPAPAKPQAVTNNGQNPPDHKPPQRHGAPSEPITGGVDSKTQFLATQGLKGNGGPIIKKAEGNVPDDQDENGLTAKQLNTTGPAAAVSDQEIQKAAGGDQEIANLLKKMDTDVEGHKALRLALDKGTTYKRGDLEGNVVGLTVTGGGQGPVITLESMSIDTAAHETAHAAYPDMSHAEVYRFGHRVEQRVNNGEVRDNSADPPTTPGAQDIPTIKDPPIPVQISSGNRGGGNRGGGGMPFFTTGTGGNPPRITGNSSGVPDDQDENGLTALQLNTTGPADEVTDEEIFKAAGGDPEIIALLKKLDEDPEGHKALRLALDKGTTYKKGELDGNVVGLTETSSDHGPVITLESMSIDTIAHETAHAAYPEMSHAEVYRFGHRVEEHLKDPQAA